MSAVSIIKSMVSIRSRLFEAGELVGPVDFNTGYKFQSAPASPRPRRSEVSRLEAGYSVDWAAKSRRMFDHWPYRGLRLPSAPMTTWAGRVSAGRQLRMGRKMADHAGELPRLGSATQQADDVSIRSRLFEAGESRTQWRRFSILQCPRLRASSCPGSACSGVRSVMQKICSVRSTVTWRSIRQTPLGGNRDRH